MIKKENAIENIVVRDVGHTHFTKAFFTVKMS